MKSLGGSNHAPPPVTAGSSERSEPAGAQESEATRRWKTHNGRGGSRPGAARVDHVPGSHSPRGRAGAGLDEPEGALGGVEAVAGPPGRTEAANGWGQG